VGTAPIDSAIGYAQAPLPWKGRLEKNFSNFTILLKREYVQIF